MLEDGISNKCNHNLWNWQNPIISQSRFLYSFKYIKSFHYCHKRWYFLWKTWFSQLSWALAGVNGMVTTAAGPGQARVARNQWSTAELVIDWSLHCHCCHYLDTVSHWSVCVHGLSTVPHWSKSGSTDCAADIVAKSGSSSVKLCTYLHCKYVQISVGTSCRLLVP